MPHDVSAVSSLYKLELWIKIYIYRIFFVQVEQIFRAFFMQSIDLIVGKVSVKNDEFATIEAYLDDRLRIADFIEGTILGHSFHFIFSLLEKHLYMLMLTFSYWI
jgi:hypothetical protein